MVVLPEIKTVPNSGSKCVVCGVTVAAGCTKVPYFARQELLLDHRLLIGPDTNCRICLDHLDGDHLKSDLEINSNLRYDAEAIDEGQLTLDDAAKVIADLVQAMGLYRERTTLDFEDPNVMDDEDYKLWTGWTRDQFAAFVPFLKENGMRASGIRTLRESLAMFWIKLKTDLSFNHIATLFGLRGDPGRLRASAAFKAVEGALNTHLVPCYLGPDHLTPKQAMKHNTAYSRAFFGDKPTTIWDGTYLYLQRSSNYSIARKLYSMQKSQNLTKFMSVVFPDGYVLDTLGPFFSNSRNNDSGMTAEILSDDNCGLRQWVEQGDQVVIADKGFVSVVPYLTKLGLECYHPSLSRGKQDSVEEANKTRMVTKVRWVVEAYHGRLKKFKFFDGRKRPSFLDHYAALVKILTASLNFQRPLLLDTDEEKRKHATMARQMLIRSEETTNPLATLVKSGTLSTGWKKVTDEMELDNPKVAPNFPRMTEEEIESKITFGTYQLRQATHYADEHLNSNSGFKIHIRVIDPDIVRVRLQSRYRGDQGYYAFVRFTANKVTQWYCQCKAGARTLGCCAHVATVVWYLSCARHNNYHLAPNHQRLWECIMDSKVSGFEDSDDDEAASE